MENRIHKYIHLFKDRKTIIDITIDMTNDDLKFNSTNKIPDTSDIDILNEYYYWLVNVVGKDVINRVTPAQIEILNKKGMKYFL